MQIVNRGNIPERTGKTQWEWVVTSSDLTGVGSSPATVLSGTYTNPGWSNSPSITASIPYSAGDILGDAYYALITPFAGTSLTELTLAVGYKGSTNTSSTAFMAATSICGAGSNVTYFSGTGSKYSALESGNITLTLTATGGTFSNLTAGEVHVFITQGYATDVYV